jgi:glyoxylase-like metal-dependent hydrolase (beta-lactamase superfamily II)
MYESISDRVGIVRGGTNIGIVRIDDAHVLLIDTGLNDTIARKVLRSVKHELGSEVAGILTTHAHADHFGAHRFVVKRTGALVFAPDLEEAVIRHPVMQPILLYGGADPLDALKGRFLLAEASDVDQVLQRGSHDILGLSIDSIPLPGHSPNQFGFLVDDVFFSADVVFPTTAIEKYRLPYLFGLTAHLESLERSRAVACRAVVPGHGPLLESIEPLVAENRAVIERVIEKIGDILHEPKSSDDVCSALFRAMDVPVSDPQSYYLLRPTIMAYLSHLERTKMIELMIDQKAALWRRR